MKVSDTTMKSIENITVPVNDRKKFKEFYLKLGFLVAIESPAVHGETWIQRVLFSGGTTISLASFHGVICETHNIENEIEDLKAKGSLFPK